MKQPSSLTQQQFNYIVSQCDAVLEKHALDFSVMGIAWLHVLHSHPLIQSRYVHVFHKRTIVGWIKRWVRGTGRLALDLFRSLRSSFQKKEDWRKLPQQTEILFISHLLNANPVEDTPDFYFQDLPGHLSKQGYPVAVGLMNHVKGFTGWKHKPVSRPGAPIQFVLPLQLSLGKELALMGRSMRTAFFFWRQSIREKDPLQKSFLRELAGSVLSPHTLRAYRTYDTITSIAAHTSVNMLAFTWEGHSWERMACYAAHTAKQEIKAIGYQHTILFPSSHALKKSWGRDYDPDVILTVGAVTKEIIAADSVSRNAAVVAYGSPRLAKAPVYKPVGEICNACLVTPEGLVDECIHLFGFAVHAARQMPGTDFIFRNHPVIHFADLQKRDPRLRNLPENVIVSSGMNLEDDFKRASWLLYRNSSVSFFAVMAGLRPVYLQLADEISNDVLYALDSWRKNISTADELQKLILEDKNKSAEDRNREREDAYTFSRNYMLPYDVSLFEPFIRQSKTTIQFSITSFLPSKPSIVSNLFAKQYLKEASEIIEKIDADQIDRMTELLLQLRTNKGRLFLVGVGGGAGHASHAVNDFRKIAGIESYSPSDNVSELTARTNDEGWETTYSAWLQVSNLNAKDMLFVFSVGGGDAERNISANIVNALKLAKETGCKIIGVVGRDGGYTAKVADACVIVPTVNKDYVTPHTESFQALVWHLIVSDPRLQQMSNKWESQK